MSPPHRELTPSSPLKVKVAVRDHWENKEASVHESIAKLKDIVGYDVSINLEWPLLLAALGNHYRDKVNFVPAVTGCIKAWCEATVQLLDDESNEQWTETVLENLKEAGSRLRLIVEVAKSEDASTSWNSEQQAFVISLPNTQVTNPLANIPTFQAHLLSAFNEGKHNTCTVPVSDAITAPGEDWAAIEIEPVLKSFPEPGPSSTSAPRTRRPNPNVEYFPDINSLPRPDELLLKPPYHLIITARSLSEIEVQCSHSPTLKFLDTYLGKWCRTNHQLTNKPPAVETSLHQCAYGLGTWHDRLTLYAENRYGGGHFITPTIILAIVEGQLGYELTYQESSRWVFRKDTPFRN
ncbi:hypothetical protein jhhlp_005728 [Lomentospora prolificans]|uniref:Uncharacterized protein n=1 Tax=Lomentospora prolificans TaxID=41688 RepID=A0A2N3N3Y4_9PEZI|nr:hypothetical protein jhhlp_005728 [Lomentospora prolificans]